MERISVSVVLAGISAILLTIIVTVFVIDIGTGWARGRLFGKEARA